MFLFWFSNDSILDQKINLYDFLTNLANFAQNDLKIKYWQSQVDIPYYPKYSQRRGDGTKKAKS